MPRKASTKTKGGGTATAEPPAPTTEGQDETDLDFMDFDDPGYRDPLAGLDLPDAAGSDDDAGDETADEETVDEFDEDLLRRAEAAGLSDEEIAAFGDADTLQRTLEIVERKAGAADSKEEAGDSGASPDKGSEEKYKVKLNRDYHDEDIVNEFERMAERVDQLETQLRESQAHLQAERQAVEDRQFDGLVESLGSDYEEVLGKGPTSTLKRGSDGLRNRAAIKSRMKVLASGYRAEGQRVPKREDLFAEAAASVLSSHSGNIARRQVTSKVSKRRSQMMMPPTHRREKALTPEDTAIQNAANYLKEKGFYSDEEEAAILQSLPE